MKKIRAVLAVCIVLCISVLPVSAAGSYTYSTVKGTADYKACPDPFLLEKQYSSADLGVDLISPEDICFDEFGNCFLLDSELSVIYVFDPEMRHMETIDGFMRNGEKETFLKPEGIALSENGSLYICDTQNNRIVLLDQNRMLEKEYLCPRSAALGENYSFKPKKIAVDRAGNMYIINSDEYQGILQLDDSGVFVAFVGSDKVKYDPIQLLWKKLMSEEQSEQLIKFVPVEYHNLSMDHAGFIYAVSAATGEEPIKRLNLSGSDILNRYGYVEICGDVEMDGEEFEPSLFVDISSDSNDTYFALDSAKCRIFAYNREGYLLYAYTGTDEFRSPAAIEVFGDRLYVTDVYSGTLSVYSSSDFGRLVIEADDLYSRGDFAESLDKWEDVLRLNANYELAYAQIGRICLRDGDYEKAMEYFEKGNFRGSEVTKLDGYNKAFVEWRKEWAGKNLGRFLLLAAALAGAFSVLKLWKKRRRKNES